jgi:aspartyl/asparaginyl-tRNA synthetase
VHTPIITSSDCEGAGEMFEVATAPAKPDGRSGAASAVPHPIAESKAAVAVGHIGRIRRKMRLGGPCTPCECSTGRSVARR